MPLLTLCPRSGVVIYKRTRSAPREPISTHMAPHVGVEPITHSERDPMAEQGHDKELKNALAQIEKQFGKGAIMQLGDDAAAQEINGISTGALSLDLALGGKGLPRGRVVEIYGPEASGKTTVALHTIAQ